MRVGPSGKAADITIPKRATGSIPVAAGQAMVSVLVEDQQIFCGELHEPGALESCDEVVEMLVDEGEQVAVHDVAGADDEETLWRAAQEVTVSEALSLETTTRSSSPASLAISASVVQFCSGRSTVWIAS